MTTVLLPRQSPHKLLLLVVATLLGAFYVFGTAPPASVAATQPPWAVYAWALGLLISGAAGLAGSFWRSDLARALRLEQAAMLLGAAAMMMYTVSLFSYSGMRALGSGLTFMLWTIANLWRTAQISGDLKLLYRSVEVRR